MRRGNDPSILTHEGKFVGINLSSDMAAEHEWGIKELQQAWGIPFEKEGVVGLNRRTITNVPVGKGYLAIVDPKRGAIFAYRNYFDIGTPKTDAEWMDHYCKHSELYFPTWKDAVQIRQELATAWSGGDFAIRVKPKHNHLIQELHEAALRKDLVIMLGGRVTPFENTGLIVVIRSRLPKEVDQQLTERDIDSVELKRVSDATGIIDYLRKAGKSYFACSPRWTDETKKEVDYWLNPMEQDKNNSGRYTVEELKLWAEGKGPIPKEIK